MGNEPLTRIEVVGTARVQCTPDAVAIRLEIRTSRKTDENAARDRLLTKAARVRRAIDEVGACVRCRRVHNPSIFLEREAEEPYRPVGWAATQHIDVEVLDLAAAHEVVAEARNAAATVDRVAWNVEATNPAHTDARVAAAADARRRAEAYAQGLGVEVGRVVSVAEGRNATGTDVSLGDVEGDESSEVSDTDDAMLVHVRAQVYAAFEVGAPR